MNTNDNHAKNQYNNLLTQLRGAIGQAKKAYSSAQQANAEIWTGGEGNEVANLLKDIWENFSSGHSYVPGVGTVDEIFKP